MSADAQTIGVYDAQAAEYARIVTCEAADPQLAAFMRLLPSGARVLDLGCGPGHSAAQMRDGGFSVTAMDGSAEMAALAHSQFGLTVKVGDFADLSDVALYDGVWANFSLLHAPKADMPGLLKAIARALCPGGVLSVGLKTGTGEHRDKIGRFYAYYTGAEISAMLERAGFTILSSATGNGKGLDGQMWPWIVLRARA